MMLQTNNAKYTLLLSLFLSVISLSISAQTDSLVTNNPILADSIASTDSSAFSIDTLSIESTGGGIDAPISYEASDSISYRVTDNKIYVYDEGVVNYQDLELSADYIDIDFEKKEVKAHGMIDSNGVMTSKPQFTQGEDTYNPDTMRYNFESKKGYAYNVKTDQEGGYLHGGKVKMHSNKEIHMKKGKYTTCDLDHPHFYVNMTRAIVIPKKKVVSGPAYMVIEGIPIPVILPFGYFPITNKRQSGILIPSFGEREGYGFYFQDLGFYLGWNEYVDFTIKTDLYTLGSWNVDLGSRYNKRYRYSGNVGAEYGSVTIDEKETSGNVKFIWTHQQDPKARPGTNFSSSVDFQTPGFSKSSSSTMTDYYKEAVSSSISYSRKLSKQFKLSANMNMQQNLSDSTITATLPSLKLSMTNTSLSNLVLGKKLKKFKFLNKINLSYKTDFENELAKTVMDSSFWTDKTFDQLDYAFRHQASVSSSFKLLKFMNVSPSVNYTERWYFSHLEKHYDSIWALVEPNGIITDTVYDFNRVHNVSFSISANTKIYGIYNLGNGPLRAMRHIMTPRVSFNYTPGYIDNNDYYGKYIGPKGEEATYSRYNGYIYSNAPMNLAEKISFGLDNNFELKVRNRKDTVKGTKVIKLIEQLSVSSGYDYAKDSIQFDKISVKASTTLFKLIRISYTQRLDPYEILGKDINRPRRLVWNSDRNRLALKDNETWTLSANISLNKAKLRGKEAKQYENENAFKMPWNLSASYSYSQTTKYQYNDSKLVDAFTKISNNYTSLNGSLTPTKNWSISGSTTFDFETNSITSARLSFTRDLHCWQMGLTWIPMGGMQSYMFKINVKADVFKDLKYDKSERYGEVIF